MALKVHKCSNEANMYIASTIAFIPSSGFMIVEGYFYFKDKENDFPVNTSILQEKGRTKDGSYECNLYKLRINKISKKYLPDEVKNRLYDEEMGGYISFFPKYIMIVYFDVISFNENKREEEYLNIKTDTRFKSAEELLTRYEKLDNYEEDKYGIDISKIEDSQENDEFFEGYFKIDKLKF